MEQGTSVQVVSTWLCHGELELDSQLSAEEVDIGLSGIQCIVQCHKGPVVFLIFINDLPDTTLSPTELLWTMQ